MQKLKTCKNCKKKYEPSRPFQVACGSACAIEWSYKLKEKRQNEQRKQERAKIKEMAVKIKTKSDYTRELQTLINRLVRMIDKGCLCISSGKVCKKENAGHLNPTSSHPHIRFNLLNIWLQSEYANTYLHGDQKNYIANLKANLPAEWYDEIEQMPTKYRDLKLSIEDLKEAILNAKYAIKDFHDLYEKAIQMFPLNIQKRFILKEYYNNLIGIYK